MGIYCKQFAVGFKTYRETSKGERKCVGVQRVADLPLMTREEAETAVALANRKAPIVAAASGEPVVEYVTLNTLSE